MYEFSPSLHVIVHAFFMVLIISLMQMIYFTCLSLNLYLSLSASGSALVFTYFVPERCAVRLVNAITITPHRYYECNCTTVSKQTSDWRSGEGAEKDNEVLVGEILLKNNGDICFKSSIRRFREETTVDTFMLTIRGLVLKV